MIVTAPFGYTPDWAKNYLESVGNTTKAILEDPVVLIESIVQESCDVVEEQGIAYAVGCVAVEIGFSIVGAKGFKAADNVDDTAKIASKADDLPGSGSGVVKSVDEVIGGGSKTVDITNDVLDSARTGSALKTDQYHAFNDIIDNYAGQATKTSLGNANLYQLEGSLNGVAGRFEWIIQNSNVTHRMFVPGGTMNGAPIKP